jgi:2-isopropylmalate synthase
LWLTRRQYVASSKPAPSDGAPHVLPDEIRIYDTTLRDGTQGEGISFSVADKLLIAERLDQFGVDYIEGGFPGSNPRDIAFFAEAQEPEAQARQAGRLRLDPQGGIEGRRGPAAAALLESGMPVLTLVGKTWLLHVKEVLRTTPEENLAMIEDSIRYLTCPGPRGDLRRRAFLRRLPGQPGLCAAHPRRGGPRGASNLSLCETNGGKLVPQVQPYHRRRVARFGADRSRHPLPQRQRPRRRRHARRHRRRRDASSRGR